MLLLRLTFRVIYAFVFRIFDIFIAVWTSIGKKLVFLVMLRSLRFEKANYFVSFFVLTSMTRALTVLKLNNIKQYECRLIMVRNRMERKRV